MVVVFGSVVARVPLVSTTVDAVFDNDTVFNVLYE